MRLLSDSGRYCAVHHFSPDHCFPDIDMLFMDKINNGHYSKSTAAIFNDLCDKNLLSAIYPMLLECNNSNIIERLDVLGVKDAVTRPLIAAIF